MYKCASIAHLEPSNLSGAGRDVVYNPVDISQTEKWTVANTLLPLRNASLSAKFKWALPHGPQLSVRDKDPTQTIVIGSFSFGSYPCVPNYFFQFCTLEVLWSWQGSELKCLATLCTFPLYLHWVVVSNLRSFDACKLVPSPITNHYFM